MRVAGGAISSTEFAPSSVTTGSSTTTPSRCRHPASGHRRRLFQSPAVLNRDKWRATVSLLTGHWRGGTLANALCRLDYALGGSSVVPAAYNHRLEIGSTGPLHFGLTPTTLSPVPSTDAASLGSEARNNQDGGIGDVRGTASPRNRGARRLRNISLSKGWRCPTRGFRRRSDRITVRHSERISALRASTCPARDQDHVWSDRG